MKNQKHSEREKEFNNFDSWLRFIKKHFKNAQFKVEDGSGQTYGEPGDYTAFAGPDLQADVVGIFSTEQNFGWSLELKKTRGARK